MSETGGPWGRSSGPSVPPPVQTPGRTPARRGPIIWLALLALTGGGFLLALQLLPLERGDVDNGEALRLMAVLAVVSSGLLYARQINLTAVARAVVGWFAIFTLAILAYAAKDDVARLAVRLRTAILPRYAVANAPQSMVVGRGEGGAFVVNGAINGAPVRFLIDTGASDIVLSPADAARAGLRPDTLKYLQPSETANGAGHSAFAAVETLNVGPIALKNVPVTVNQAPMSDSLLGMTFLRRLESFEVRGDQLFLRGRPGN